MIHYLLDGSYLYRHGFFDDKILALKTDNANEYAYLVDEIVYEDNLKSSLSIDQYLNNRYLLQIDGISQSKTLVSQSSENTKYLNTVAVTQQSIVKTNSTNVDREKEIKRQNSIITTFIVALILSIIFGIGCFSLFKDSKTDWQNSGNIFCILIEGASIFLALGTLIEMFKF